MVKKGITNARRTGVCLAFLCAIVAATNIARADDDRNRGNWIVGTWYLALSSEPFGLPPGLPLSGLAIFNRDGTFQFLDGGDFGQATFLNTQNSHQFGAWRIGRHGKVIGTALSFEADLLTGEVLRWAKANIVLHRTDDRDVVSGSVNVSILECSNMLPIPTPLTCPDPIESADAFVVVPPTDIPLTFRRLRPDDDGDSDSDSDSD
jgi:hypothetical protein